jgi:hypothetical protein
MLFSSRGARLDARLRDESIDHLAGSKEQVKAERRVARRAAVGTRVIAALKEHGNGYNTASAALRSAAERHFGSWANACAAAGLPAPLRGRPRKD